MTFFPGREILRRRADIGLIAVFFMLLWLPFADAFLHLDHAAAPNENRVPAKFPTFQATLKGTGKFLAGLEAFFNDSFGFRRQLVRWRQVWYWKFFHDIQAGSNTTVLVGKGDWLFFSELRTVNDIIGVMPLTPAELEGWRALFTGRRDWLRERGIRYLFVVPPDKQSVYPERMPDWLIARRRHPQRLEQFLDYMRTHSDVPILDLRETLLDAKKHADVYFHTDTHWNSRGAFAAYRRIVQEVTALGIPSTPLEADAFQETWTPGRTGDLAQMMGLESLIKEMANSAFSPKPTLPPLHLRTDKDLIRKKWVPNTEPRVAQNPGANGRIVMFHDSYTQYLFEFLGRTYGRVVFVWQQHWNKQFIEREKPDIVIDEMLERAMIFQSPEDLRKLDEEPDAPAIGD